MLSYQENYALWSKDPAFDEETRQEVLALRDEKEIEERFYKDLEFGTAGLRGIMGAGTNRINSYTVGRATLGLARHLEKKFPNGKKDGVVIAYDTRMNSDTLARRTADVFTACGFRVYLFDQCVPTPTLSFAVRHFHCVSGVVLTASHNPPIYNGYKAYDETGCQIGIEEAESVLSEIGAIRDWGSLPQKGNDDLLTFVGKELIHAFTDAVLTQSTFEDRKAKENLKLVYTPIHGTGHVPVLQILEKDGFRDVTVVEEQRLPDGKFPTVKSPNPEERGALEMGIALAERIGADLVIGTDPDADRIGCAVRHRGETVLLSGNQVGALLCDFLLQNRTGLEKRPVVINTIVTGDMGRAIAEGRGAASMQVLTGFKFIGEKVSLFEKEKEESPETARHFVLGYEESYGYLSGTHARDKDAVVASMLIAEMAAFHKKAGKTLVDALNDLYREFGYYLDKVESFTLQGKEGLEEIARIMKTAREEKNILPDVEKILDYKNGLDSLPPSNVLKFYLKGGSWVAMRPSGTEPKIKFYYCIRSADEKGAEKAFTSIRKALVEKFGLA